jgi:membrane protease YdiL (CAAX protease family)
MVRGFCLKKNILFGIIGFIVLDLYFNLFAIQFSNSYVQLTFILLFFPLAHYTAKFAGLNGLAGIGLVFHQGWARNFLISFWIGFSFWAIWNAYYFVSGSYHYQGINNSFWGMPLLEVVVGYLLGSIINDLMVRGYLINVLKDKMNIKWVLSISIFAYAIDDFWYEGFSLDNMIFSILLGISLTYVFYKTGSIWANTGIHFGLNMVYGLVFGQQGKPNSSLIHLNDLGTNTFLSPYLDKIIPLLMFLFILWAIKFYHINGDENKWHVTVSKTI